jgi:hypothetical protein
MYPIQTVYPLFLAGVNVAVGSLLYYLLESVLGVSLVAVGALVVCAAIGRTLVGHRPVRGNSA